MLENLLPVAQNPQWQRSGNLTRSGAYPKRCTSPGQEQSRTVIVTDDNDHPTSFFFWKISQERWLTRIMEQLFPDRVSVMPSKWTWMEAAVCPQIPSSGLKYLHLQLLSLSSWWLSAKSFSRNHPRPNRAAPPKVKASVGSSTPAMISWWGRLTFLALRKYSSEGTSGLQNISKPLRTLLQLHCSWALLNKSTAFTPPWVLKVLSYTLPAHTCVLESLFQETWPKANTHIQYIYSII